MNYLTRHWRLLLIILLFVLAGLFLWLEEFPDSSINEFGLNFFTEMLGVAITVLIVERLIEQSKKSDQLPLLAIQYEGIRLLLSRFIVFWQRAYEFSVPDNAPKDNKSFLTKEIFEKIFNHLYLKAKAPAIPKQDWGEYASKFATEWKELGQKIIERDNSVLEPQILLALHSLIEAPFINTLERIVDMRDFDEANGFVRPQVFRCHVVFPSEDELSSLYVLLNWCDITHPVLVKNLPNVDHKTIAKFRIDPKRKLPLPAMADPVVLKKEADHSGLDIPIEAKP